MPLTQILSVSRPIAWGEMDAFGHLNNVHYFRYIEDARIAFLDALNFFEYPLYSVILKNECSYKQPVFYPDMLTTKALVTQVGQTSFVMQYDIYSQAQNCCVASANSVIVLVCKDSFAKQQIPPEMKTALLHYLQQSGQAA